MKKVVSFCRILEIRDSFGKSLALCMGLFSLLTGCLTSTDTHPDVPFFPQLDNAAIRVDSLKNTTVNNFIFSADKTKFYAIVLTSSTGVSAQHTLVEYNQTGHPLRQLMLGDLGIIQTELALIQGNSLVWRYANVFHIIDLQQLKVIDEVPVCSIGNYPDAKKDGAALDKETSALFDRKQKELRQQFAIQKIDSVSLEILEGNKANADAYWAAVQKARKEIEQIHLERQQTKYEEFALKQVKASRYFFAYPSPDGYTQYLFSKLADGSRAAYSLDKATIEKNGFSFVKTHLNSSTPPDRRRARFAYSADQSISDNTSSLRITEKITTKYNATLVNGLPDEYLFYYELKLGSETASFKWFLPLQVSNDFYLQSANGSVYVLKQGVLFWFQAKHASQSAS